MSSKRKATNTEKAELRKEENKSDLVLKQCREFFQEMDINGDGKLDRVEFAAMLQRIGLELNACDIKKAYNKADKNRDGSITFREFLDYYSSEYGSNRGTYNTNESTASNKRGSNRGTHNANGSSASYTSNRQGPVREKIPLQRGNNKSDLKLNECREYFQKMDRDGDGLLDAKEFANMMEHIGLELDATHVKIAFKKVDKNADGGITFKEFLEYYGTQMNM